MADGISLTSISGNSAILYLDGGLRGEPGLSGGGDVYLTNDQTFLGTNTFLNGILLPDTNNTIWLLTVNTDGSLQTSQYFGSSLLNAIISEDGNSYIVSEDGANYFAQEAI